MTDLSPIARAAKSAALCICVLAVAALLFKGVDKQAHASNEPAETPPVAGAVRDNDPSTLRYPPDAPQLASIQLAVAHEHPLPAGDAVNGRVAYDENVTVRVVSPVLGRVTTLHGEVGDRVHGKAVLAELDSPDLAQAQSDFVKARADEAHKKLTLERTRALAETETASRRDQESAEADLIAAVAETQRAAQKMRNLQSLPAGPAFPATPTDGHYAVRSPLAGVIVDKQINPGMEVRPDLPAPLYTVTDPERMWVIADVPERALAGIHIGQPVEVYTDAWPGQRFPGKVDVVQAAVDPSSRRVQVRCAVHNPGVKLKAEMYVRVAFVADPHIKAVEVPNSALVLQGRQHVVIVQTHPGVFRRREVAVSISGADTSFVTEGLADGEKIVSDGALLLLSEFPAHAR